MSKAARTEVVRRYCFIVVPSAECRVPSAECRVLNTEL